MVNFFERIVCYFRGHWWGERMMGWQMNPDWDIKRDVFHLPDPSNPMTLPWRHVGCRTCGIIIDWHAREFYKTYKTDARTDRKKTKR